MDGSTVVPLNDLEVDYDENDFDTGWTYSDNKNEDKPEVLLCLQLHSKSKTSAAIHSF